MNERDKSIIIERYNQRLKRFGTAMKTLATGTEARRRIRYSALTEIGDLRGKKILDLGCGFGALWDFLKAKGIACSYTGYDINPNMIDVARMRHPDCRFKVIDILKEPFPMFDYILSSTSFNYRLRFGDNYRFIKRMLEVAYRHARKGVAFDFLTSYADFKRLSAFYYRPEKVLSIAKGITRRVSLRHDYPLFEFCIYLFKDIKFPYRREK